MNPQEIIKQIAAENSECILFHSGSGKDSIALLHMLHPHFKKIVCVYMYVVKDLSHINKFISYAENKYPNVKFYQVPHYSVYSSVKYGFLGCKTNPKQKQFRLTDITEVVRQNTGVKWVFMGFKQSDSLNRRLMLRGYREEAINDKTSKCYPFTHWKNADVIQYIKENNLIFPEIYGSHQSNGTCIDDAEYLLFLEKNYPADLQKVYADYPAAETILFQHKLNKTVCQK